MSEGLELCPECKKGSLRPVGPTVDIGEHETPFRPVARSDVMICDNCGHKQENRTQREYTSSHDKVSASVHRSTDNEIEKGN